MRASIAVIACLLAACGQDITGLPSADWVLTNGKIFTANQSQPWAEAVVIRDGEFVFVGDNDSAKDFSAGGTRTTNLHGRVVIPGIIDSHTHPGLIEFEQYDAVVSATVRDDFFEQLKAWADNNPGDDWARISCWPNAAFVSGNTGPDRRDLDPLFPDRPVWITSCAWHSYWLNTKALDELGIDAGIADPKFPIAIYKRDDAGRLTGWLKEGAGWKHFAQVFEPDVEAHQAAVLEMLQLLNEYGVTTLYDAGNLNNEDYVFGFLRRIDDAGELPLRYEGTFMITIPEERDIAISEMRRFRKTYGSERLRFNTIKLFMDGIHENRSGAMLEPYADDPNYISDTTLSVEELSDFLLELHDAKFDLHVHVIGDLAVKSVLDAVEKARAVVGDEFYPRVSMGHLQNTDPGDWPRFASLGVSANFTPWWHGFDDPDAIEGALGNTRDNDTYRAKALIDAGANVTFSSDDWHLDVLSPYLGMQVGTTRQYPQEWLLPENDPEAFRHPQSDRLAIEDMIMGYTINGAYQLRMEDYIGSIEPGKSADLVIFADDLFEVDASMLSAIKPLAVVMAGEKVQGSLDEAK